MKKVQHFNPRWQTPFVLIKVLQQRYYGHCFKFYNYFLPGFLEGDASNFNPARLLIKMLDQRTQ